jgi:hypothetical protein
MRFIGKLGGSVILVSALTAMPLALATGASASPTPPVTLQPGQTTPVQAQTWTMGAPTGDLAPDIGIGGLCKGSFEGPSADITDGMTSGVFVQCTESATLTAGTTLYRCVRDGGPDDFDCTPVATNFSGLVVAYYVNVQASYTKCSHEKSAEYQPEADRLSVNGVDYPNVFGNVVSVGCG